MGLECKNVREWLYPNQADLKEALAKCLELNCIPVIIARRIPYVTFRLFSSCGAIFHQTYNQLFPIAARDVAAQAANKDLLGYHDIRVGNDPDRRLTTFISTNMMAVASVARPKFEAHRHLLTSYVFENDYRSFAARVRRRELGQNEDFDQDAEADPADWIWGPDENG